MASANLVPRAFPFFVGLVFGNPRAVFTSNQTIFRGEHRKNLKVSIADNCHCVHHHIDRHIRVYFSDDEQFVRNISCCEQMPLYCEMERVCVQFNIHEKRNHVVQVVATFKLLALKVLWFSICDFGIGKGISGLLLQTNK